jgi:hypothetical protein
MHSKRLLFRFFTWPLVLVAMLALAALACGPLGGGAYEETFDSAGSWGEGTEADATGAVTNGRYELLVNADLGLWWSSGGEDFDDGVYEVEATQLEGPVDNGYGMIFRADENDNFYLFEISGDGFTWIGRCAGGCEDEVVALVGDGWVASDAVNTGLNATNRLRVQAEGANLIFFVNDQEVGRVTDTTYSSGDIGVLVETLGEGGVKVGFDNFNVTPLDEVE